MQQVGVRCKFKADGRVQVQEIKMQQGGWFPVEQGRQWVDPTGRHVLVMLPGQIVHELWLRTETMSWILKPIDSGRKAV